MTSYGGKVAAYQRTPERLRLTIHTDWDTTEEVSINLRRGEDVRSHFLLWGEPFGEHGLDEIEDAPGKLRPEMGVIAWVCESGPQPVIDWRPPKKEQD